ncbi:MAG TPA: NAD(P)-binding domain-containing protein [Acetobacteraceae bacterium]|nr:NAD(P)-binding domain-containing protein [Acetobacteraceae bacterium]
MKLGIVGMGAVGAAIAMAASQRGSAREMVLVNRHPERSKAVALDMHYGAPLSKLAAIRAGDYDDLAGAGVVVITAGINEKAGGATDRSDPQGRLRLFDKNVEVFQDVVPRVKRAAPGAVIVIATDPPDPLAEIARAIAGHERVISTGTYLDTLRFRVHLAERFGISPATVDANVVGEHGTSSVFLWSSASIGGMPLPEAVVKRGWDFADFRQKIEKEVREANIAIIEGIGASQYGIGILSARIAETILRDEREVVPIGSHNPRYGTTISLPSVVGKEGILDVMLPDMSPEELRALEESAERLRGIVRGAMPKLG